MMEFTAEMIAGFLGGEIVGDKAASVHTVSSIEEGKGRLAGLPDQSEIRTLSLYDPGVHRPGEQRFHTVAARCGHPRQGARRRSLRPQAARDVQRRQAPPQGHQPPRLDRRGCHRGRRVLHRRLHGRRAGRADRPRLPDLPAGLSGPRGHRRRGDDPLPRGGRSTKGARWAAAASSTPAQ